MALLRRESERLPQSFQPFGRDLFDWPFRPFEAWQRLFDEEQVNIEEFVEDGEIVVRAELPGVNPDEDVDITIVDGNLHIRAERRQEEKIERRNYRRSEIRYGSFVRTLPLPAGTKEDEIKASYRNGILEVRAPVQQHQPGKSKITIQKG